MIIIPLNHSFVFFQLPLFLKNLLSQCRTFFQFHTAHVHLQGRSTPGSRPPRIPPQIIMVRMGLPVEEASIIRYCASRSSVICSAQGTSDGTESASVDKPRAVNGNIFHAFLSAESSMRVGSFMTRLYFAVTACITSSDFLSFRNIHICKYRKFIYMNLFMIPLYNFS